MASTDSAKSSVCAPGSSIWTANTMGTKTSSQSRRLWRISSSRGFMGVPEFSDGASEPTQRVGMTGKHHPWMVFIDARANP